MKGDINSTSLNDRYRVQKPTGLKDVPRFLRELCGTFLSRLFYIFRLVWDTKKSLLFLMCFMALFNGVMPVIGSLIGAKILNRLAEVYAGAALAFSAISVLLVLQFVYTFLSTAVTNVYTTLLSVSGELITNHVKCMIMGKAREVDCVSFDSPDFYSRMENANREAGMRPLNIMRSAFSVLSILISIVSYVIVLFAVNSWAPLVIILVSIPSTIVSFTYRKKNVNYMFFRSKNRRQMDYYSSTLIDKDLVKEIRMFNLADTFIDKYRASFAEYYKGLRKLQLEECLYGLLVTALASVVYCVLYILIARGVYDGVYAVGNFSLYSGAIQSIGSGVSALITGVAGIYEGTLFIENLRSFMEEKPSIVPTLPEPRKIQRHTDHTIEFRHVSFRYPGAAKNALSDISLTIRSGETVVIVGYNGAGKTTLVKLLTRLYDPTEGVILLDGHDIREYDVNELYDMFGIIFQDYGKYAVSAKENILFGDLGVQKSLGEEKSMEAVRAAAAESGADAFIEKLPQGYDTPLMRYFEADGAELSGGQWQKLAIARAFYADSDILILDEPTASLDPIAEAEVFRQFNTLRKGKTSIFISHRLSSATTADNIFVMENGALAESGTHEALMKKGGLYCSFFTTQATPYQL